MRYCNYESYIYLAIMWFIGCIIGWFMIPDMSIFGALVGGNSVITCAIIKRQISKDWL